MSICYHGFSETPGPSKDCEVCIAFKERDRYKAALEEIKKGVGPFSMNRMEHATNTIEAMKALADEALIEKPIDAIHLNSTRCVDCGASLTDGHTHPAVKRVKEPQMECSSCHTVSADVQPYCSKCYMDV